MFFFRYIAGKPNGLENTRVKHVQLICMARYGDMLSAWLEGLDRNGTGNKTGSEMEKQFVVTIKY